MCCHARSWVVGDVGPYQKAARTAQLRLVCCLEMQASEDGIYDRRAQLVACCEQFDHLAGCEIHTFTQDAAGSTELGWEIRSPDKGL